MDSHNDSGSITTSGSTFARISSSQVTIVVVAIILVSISCGFYSGNRNIKGRTFDSISSISTSGSTFSSISVPQVTIVVAANILALAVAFTVEYIYERKYFCQ